MSEPSQVVRGTFEIVNALGLHARAAARLAHLAEEFSSKIEVEKDGERVDAKSIMGLLLICGQPGTSLHVIANGPDAAKAIEKIGILVASGFGEGA